MKLKLNYNFAISGVIDYNFFCFRNAIQQVFELRNKALAAASTSGASTNNHSTSPISNNLTEPGPSSVGETSVTQSLITMTNTTAAGGSGLPQNGTIVLAQS